MIGFLLTYSIQGYAFSMATEIARIGKPMNSASIRFLTKHVPDF